MKLNQQAGNFAENVLYSGNSVGNQIYFRIFSNEKSELERNMIR